VVTQSASSRGAVGRMTSFSVLSAMLVRSKEVTCTCALF